MFFKEKPTETVNAKGKEEGTTTIIKLNPYKIYSRMMYKKYYFQSFSFIMTSPNFMNNTHIIIMLMTNPNLPIIFAILFNCC